MEIRVSIMESAVLKYEFKYLGNLKKKMKSDKKHSSILRKKQKKSYLFS